MKVLTTIIMVVGVLLIVLGSLLVIDSKTLQDQKVIGTVFVICGNTLFGSGFISRCYFTRV